jgi:hypothetical protein
MFARFTALAGRACGLGVLLFVVSAQAGCTSSRARSVVKGKITFSNRPITSGTISFISDDNKHTGAGPIKQDGTYTVNDAPVGNVKIVVTVPRQMPMMGGRGGSNMPKPPKDSKMPAEMIPPDWTEPKAPAGNQTPVPEKYTKADSTPLTYTVTAGEQTHDINLTP